MFKSPPTPKLVMQAPVLLGADDFTLNRVHSGGSPGTETFTYQSGRKVHLPGITWVGSKLYYAGIEIKLWFAAVINTLPDTRRNVTIVTPTNPTYTFGTDANGPYMQMGTDYTYDFFNPAYPYTDGTWYLAMVFTDNTFNTWPSGPMPPAVLSGSITG